MVRQRLILALLLLAATTAEADHFQGGIVTWRHNTSNSYGNVLFTVKGYFHVARFPGGVGQPATFGGTAQTFNFGDGTSTVLSTSNCILTSKTTTTGEVQCNDLPHAYADGSKTYVAYFSSGNRRTDLKNNALQSYRVQSTVALAGGKRNSAPVPGILPITYVMAPTGTPSLSISIAATDPDGDPITFAFTPPTAMGSASATQPSGLSLDATGVATWSVTGLASGWYSVAMQVSDTKGNVASMDWVLDLVSYAPDGRETVSFGGPTPSEGSALSLTLPGPDTPATLSFVVQATSTNGGAAAIYSLGLPADVQCPPFPGVSPLQCNWTTSTATSAAPCFYAQLGNPDSGGYATLPYCFVLRAALPTSTPTPTLTVTRTQTSTRSPTHSITSSLNQKLTRTLTPTPTQTATLTRTRTSTPTRTLTQTATHSPTQSSTHSITSTLTPTVTATSSLTRRPVPPPPPVAAPIPPQPEPVAIPSPPPPPTPPSPASLGWIAAPVVAGALLPVLAAGGYFAYTQTTQQAGQTGNDGSLEDPSGDEGEDASELSSLGYGAEYEPVPGGVGAAPPPTPVFSSSPASPYLP